MFKYCSYCLVSLLKKKTVWVSTLIYWLFFSLILFAIPLAVQLSPFTVWSNGMMDLQSYTIIILALICASAAVVIFKDPKDDGTELIVFSKSITRTKIMAGKFIAFLITGLVIIGVTCILFLFTQLNSHYKAGEIGKYLSSYIIGATITFVLFMGIAIIISCVSGKIGIMVSTIGLSILLNITHITLPMFATTPSDYISKKYNVDFSSNRAIVANDGKNSLKNYVSMSTPGTTEKTAWDYAKDSSNHNTSKMVSYADFGGQIGDTYFAANSGNDLSFSSFGSSTNVNYYTTSDKSLFENIIVPKNNNRFYAWPLSSTLDGKQQVTYRALGMLNRVPGTNSDFDQDIALALLSALGSNSNSVANIITRNNYMGGNNFIDLNIMDNIDDRDYVNYIFDKYLWYGQRWSTKPTTVDEQYKYNWIPNVQIGGDIYNGNDMGYTIGRDGTNGSAPEDLIVKVEGYGRRMLFPGQSMYFGNATTDNIMNPVGRQQYYFDEDPSLTSRTSFVTDCGMLLNKDPDSASASKTGSIYTYPQKPDYQYDGSLYDTPDGNSVPDFNALDGHAGPGMGQADITAQYPEWATLTGATNKAYKTHASSDNNIQLQSGGTLPKESVQDHLIKALGPYDPKWDDEIKLNVAFMKLYYMYVERMSSIYWNPDRWYVDVNSDFQIPSYSPNVSIEDDGNVSKCFSSSQTKWSNTYYDKKIKINNIPYTPFDDSQIIKILGAHDQYRDIPNITSRMCASATPNLIPGQQILVIAYSGEKGDSDRHKDYELYNQTHLYVGSSLQRSGIKGVQDMYPYDYSLYLTNLQEAIIWAAVSFAIFGVIVIIYSKADFK